jgi:hypothetical protein
VSKVETSSPVERSLLDEIEELQVLEAAELQEGVAFHAFRFRASPLNDVMDSVILTTKGESAPIADKLLLPRGATIMEVYADKMLILFDPNKVGVADIKKALATKLGDQFGDLAYDPAAKYAINRMSK